MWYISSAHPGHPNLPEFEGPALAMGVGLSSIEITPSFTCLQAPGYPEYPGGTSSIFPNVAHSS